MDNNTNSTQEEDGFEVVDATEAIVVEQETIEEGTTGSLMDDSSSLVEGVVESSSQEESVVHNNNNGAELNSTTTSNNNINENNTTITTTENMIQKEQTNGGLKIQKPSIQPRIIPGPPIYDPNKFPIMDGGHGGVLVTGMAASVSSSLSSGSVISSILGASKEITSALPFQLPFDSSSNEKFSLSNVYQENAEKFKRFRYRSSWGANNLLAYCCQTHVMIFDPVSMQQVTSLFGHRFVATCVEWCEMSKSRGIERGNTNIVASGDEGGCIVVWDYKKGRKLCSFAEDYGNTKKSIVQIKWLNGDNVYLLSLATNNVLSLWNVQTNTRIWDLEFPDTITGFSLDPFTLKSCCLPSESGWSYFINDINIKKKPIDIQRRLHGSIDKKTGATQTSLKDFICSPHTRDQFYVVTKKEVTTFDLAIKQTIHGKQLKGGRADFQTLYPIESDPSVFYSLHEDGTVCVWEYNGEKFELNVCDVVRGSKHGADRPGLLYGLSISPIDHSKVAAVSADGKIWIWRVNLSNKMKSTPPPQPVVEEQAVPVPTTSRIKVNTKWMLEGLAEYTGSVISSIKVSPSDDRVAVGTISGLLLVYDLLTGSLLVKHDVFNNSPVLGIRWFGLDSVLCFSSSVYEKKKDKKSNELRIVNLVSGKHTSINVNREDQHKKEESKAGGIKGIRISNSYKYLVIILQDRPIEVWRLDTLKLIRMIPFSNVTSLEWVPLSKHHPERELLYFTTTDGSLHFYKVENYKVEPDVKKPKVFVNTITALAWKNDRLVSGDVSGSITIWDLQHKKTKTIQTHRGLVKKISVSKEHNHILVLFNEGDFGIWDLDQYAKVANSPPYIKAVASDWARGNYPVIATNSGSILVFDIQLSTCNTNVLFHTVSDHLKNPCPLKSDEAQYFRALIENNRLPFDDMIDENSIIDEPNTFRNCCGVVVDNKKTKTLQEKGLDYRYLLPQSMVDKLKNTNTNTAERCLIAAEYFGDKIAYQFWKLAIEFLGKFSKQNINPSDVQKEAPPAEEDHFFTEQTELERFDSNACYRSSLPSTFDLLRDNESVRNEEMKILQQHDQTLQHKIKSGSSTEQIQDLFSLVARSESELLQKDQAVKTLLQTPLDSKNLYANFLHATVLAASNSPSHFKETVQFVASSLISLKKENDIEFGVQLLCSIGEGLKACRILQDFDMWEKAARIAKSILPEHESLIVLTKWADYLQSNNQLLKSIGVWMSLGLFKEVLDLLHKSELDDIASLFTKAYDEYLPHIPLNELHRYFVLRVSSPSKLSEPLYSSSKSHDDFEMTCRKLKYFVYQQYAVFLDKIGCNELADHYKVLIDGKDVGLTLPPTPNNLSSLGEGVTSSTLSSLDLNRQESWVVVDSTTPVVVADSSPVIPTTNSDVTNIPVVSEDLQTDDEE